MEDKQRKIKILAIGPTFTLQQIVAMIKKQAVTPPSVVLFHQKALQPISFLQRLAANYRNN